MISMVSCSWCHAMNSTNLQFCPVCYHEVGKPRLACCCAVCVNRSLEALDGGPPVDADGILIIDDDDTI